MAGLLDLFPGLGGLLGGQMPPQQQQQYTPQQMPTLPLPADPNRLGAAFQNFGHGHGLFGGLADAMTGFTTGQRTDPVGMYQQQANQVYQSLMRAGYPEPQARLAAVDPQTLKNITALPEIKETGTDPFTGQKSFAEYRPQVGTLTPLGGQSGQGQPGQGPGGSLGAFQNAVNNGVTGSDLYQHLPAGMRPVIQAMIEGRRAPPTGMGMRNPAVLAMVEAAHAIDPSFDETTWGVRNATAKNYLGGGKQFQELQALNTVSGHLENLTKSAAGLDNYQFPKVNSVVNYLKQSKGDPAIDKFNYDLHVVSDELAKAYHAGRVTDSEVKNFNSAIDSSKSPDQLRSVIGEMNDLLKSKTEAIQQGYVQGMGPSVPLPKEFQAESEKSRQRFENVNKYAHPELYQAPAAPQQAAPGQPAVAAATPGAAPLATSNLPKVASPADAAKLPKGSKFIDPFGNVRTVP